MKTLIRPAQFLTVLVPLILCVFGLRYTCAPVNLRHAFREARRGEELDRLQRASMRRLKAKQEVAQALRAGRYSLQEALALLQELDREWLEVVHRECPHFPDLWTTSRVVIADKDGHYRFLRATLEDDRSREATALLRRLAKDYERLQPDRLVPAGELMRQAEPGRCAGNRATGGKIVPDIGCPDRP